MSFFKRLTYYAFGFSIGLLLLTFIFSGKKTTCNYSPNDRVIANILKKPLEYDFQIDENNFIDSIDFLTLLKHSKVDFSESNVELDSCRIYGLAGFWEEKKMLIKVENCKKKARIIQVKPIE